ncbi:hypothetical protein C5167_023070 [Papaver somniferum]|uniref:Aminotransferase-like plant mobile domain-containing protein n=1 Tax=Papaver somniferum TaxID=3469 RepID=A0A4Y7JKQ0_PAPSO|nr:hypothetical protein C5167_023070 [Papaver somniferum]
MNYCAPAVTETTNKKGIPSIVRSYDSPTHGHSDDAELAAFLTYWLNHEFFECSPRDIIQEDLFRIAVKMARGVTYPLSPMFLGGVYRHLDTLISDMEAANNSRHVIESFVPTSFLQMWFWERFPASRSGVNKLVVRNDNAPSTSGWLPNPPTRYPRTSLDEKQHVKKATNEFMWIVDDLGSFEARPYDSAPPGISFLGPDLVFLEDVLDSETSSLSDDDWDFISIASPGYNPGYFEGKFCAVNYNVDRVARQLAYDQGLASILPNPADDIGFMQNCYRCFVFKPDGPRYCRDGPFSLVVPPPKNVPKFMQVWCTNWYDELTRMIGFVCDVADPVEAVSPRKLNDIGRIRLYPEVASAHGIKDGSRGKSSKSSTKKETNIPAVSEQRPHVVVRNRGASVASSRGQQGSRVGGASSLQSSASSSNPQEKSMGRAEQAFEKSNSSRKRKHQQQSGQIGSGSRNPEPMLPAAIGSPGSLIGQATWFDFKGASALMASIYAHYVLVYNFPVPPELKDYCKEIVEEYGHVASTKILADRNNLVPSFSTLVSAAKEMVEMGDRCLPVSTLEIWRSSFVILQLLKFNMGWIEEIYKRMEERREGRQLVLPGEITSLKEEVKAETQKLKEQQKEQIRITAVASKIGAEIAAISTRLQLKQKELADKEAELASFE